MIRRYIEMTCDNCNCACHYPVGSGGAEKLGRADGWIITADGRHYDSAKCREEARLKAAESQATDA